MLKTTMSQRRKRSSGNGDAADGQASNKRSPPTSVLTSLDVNDAPRPELPLFQLSRPRQQAGQDDDDKEEEEEVRRRRSRVAVAKEDIVLRAAIPVRQRVAVCVWRLATGEPLRLVSKRFGLAISTCHKLVLEVCAAIRGLLMSRFLRWLDAAAAEAFKARFKAESGIPGVVGVMYTTHIIPIIAPKASVAAYFNRRHTERNHKTSYSITLHGVVGPDGAFTDVCIGWPGSMGDEQVLEQTALQQRATAAGGMGMMAAGSWVVGG